MGAEKGVSVALPESTDLRGRRKVFGDNGDEMVVGPADVDVGLDDLAGLDSDEEGDGATSEDEEDAALDPAERVAKQRKRHNLAVKRRKLEGLQGREEQLSAALKALEDQRARMNGGAGGVNKNGQKFKARQRQR